MTYEKQADLGNSPAQKQRTGLPFPPVVTTNLPTSGFNMDRNHIQAVIRTPNGFLDEPYANGLCVMYRVQAGDGYEGDPRDVYRFALHKPVKNFENLATGWVNIEAPYEGPTTSGVLGAQRRGQYIYGVGGQTTSGTGAFRYQFVDRFNGLYGRERRHHDNSVYFEGLGGAASGAPLDSLMYAENNEMFVSDTDPPQIWWLSDNSVGRIIDDGTTWAWHWQSEDQRGFGFGDDSTPYYATHRFKFPFWHTWQDYEAPDHAIKPALVQPWSGGDYDEPEMWWFIPERLKTGEFTKRLNIYRSHWKRNQYRADRGWVRLGPRWVAGDPRLGTPPYAGIKVGDLVAGRTSQSDATTNTEGLAFDHDWFNEDHLVGTVGPFRGAKFRADPQAYIPKVIRDPRRHNKLTMALLTRDSVYGDGWDGAWYVHSADDGKTWGRARHISPAIKDRDGFNGGPYAGTPSLTLATNGDLIIPAVAAYHGQAHQSLASVNYNHAGVGSPEQLSVVFRRGEGGVR